MKNQEPSSHAGTVAREIAIAMGEVGLRCVFVLDSIEQSPEFHVADAARITKAVEKVGAAALEVQDALRSAAARKERR